MSDQPDPPSDHTRPAHAFARSVAALLHRTVGRIAFGVPVFHRHTPATIPPGSVAGESRGALLAFNRYGRAYFQRWLAIGALIGVVAGLGAILFASAIAFGTHVLLGGIAGFVPPSPAGEGATSIIPITRPWLLPVVTTLGGLLTGFIVFTFAPEAEGHGTDAAIDAFHEKGGRIRSRIPLIKLVASAITIGSGGSAGREGPTAQISAGFGSWLGDLLKLDDHDRRIAVAAGIGSGIGAIFKAPFGGALLSAEILYKRDFEADALFPSFIASVIGFAIYGAWAGWTPVFGAGGHYQFNHVSSLLGYLILGICAGLVGLIYPRTLYGTRAIFHRIPIPNHFKPAIGGLLVGLIGLVLPQALGMGYGFAQFSINGDFVHIAAWLMAVLVFVKILTTSLTIGSGGSGGVFGPGMVIGGFLGGALWAALHAVAPGLVAGTNAGAFAVVGMGAFFGGIAKAPLAVILMVAEMTGEYSLIAPAMLATMVAYLITGDTSIYESQVPTRLDSPAHKNDYALPLLQSLTVRDTMASGAASALATATPDTPVSDLAALFRERHVASIPILDAQHADRLVGMVTPTDLARVAPDAARRSRARQIMSRAVVRAFPDESLYQAWLRMSRRGLRQLPVVDRADPTRLRGMVTAEMVSQVLRAAIATRGASASTQPAASGSSSPSAVSPPGFRVTPRPVLATQVARTPAETEDEEEDADGDVSDDRVVLDGATVSSRPAAVAAAGATPGIQLGNNAPLLTSQAQDHDPLGTLHVADAMLTTPRLIHESDPIDLAKHLLDERGSALMVVDGEGMLVGIVTRSDLRDDVGEEGNQHVIVGDVAVRNLVTARPDETLRVAVRRMSRLGLRQLPVVPGPLPAAPVGMLRRADVLAAYERALAPTTAPG